MSARHMRQVTAAVDVMTANLHTVTALSRWSILSSQLPAIDGITTIHVYDFDNTLFKTPLPNPKLWNSVTLGRLGSPDIFVNGGWWHDSRILAATGDGVEVEEGRAWEGWWNEKIVELVKLSMKQKDALCVLLTGRTERGFSDLIKRIVTSKGLKFDMIGLKPEVGPSGERFMSTMLFKQAFLTAVMETYRDAQEIRIYEDRAKHVLGFREFLDEFNKRKQQSYNGTSSRGTIVGEVVQVADISITLDPVVEVAEVTHLVNSHNAMVGKYQRLAISKTVFFTSYMIKPEDTKKLIALVAPTLPDGELKYQANAIIITPRPCPAHILEKIGGMNAGMKWGVAGIGSWDNNLWAVSLQPVPASAPFHTESGMPSVVIATRRTARPSDVNKIQQWLPIPPEKVFAFETQVGEKVMLQIRSEENEDENAAPGSQPRYKRKYTKTDGDDRPARSTTGGHGNFGSRGYHTPNYQNRGGGRGNFRAGPSSSRGGYRGFARGRGGGRGGRGGYRSLDDVGGYPAPSQSAAQPDYNQSGAQQGGQWQPPNGAPNSFGTGGPDLQKFY